MKTLILGVSFSLFASVAAASPLTCWYHSDGSVAGRDGGSHSVPESQWDLPYAIPSPEAHNASDNSYLIVLSTYDNPNDACPEQVNIQN